MNRRFFMLLMVAGLLALCAWSTFILGCAPAKATTVHSSSSVDTTTNNNQQTVTLTPPPLHPHSVLFQQSPSPPEKSPMLSETNRKPIGIPYLMSNSHHTRLDI